MYTKNFYSVSLVMVFLFFAKTSFCRGSCSVRYQSSTNGVMNFFNQRGLDLDYQWKEFKASNKQLDEIKQDVIDICISTAESFQQSDYLTMWDNLILFFGQSQIIDFTQLNSSHLKDVVLFGRTWEWSLEWPHPKNYEMRNFFLAVAMAMCSFFDEIQELNNFQIPELIVNNIRLGQCFLYDISFVSNEYLINHVDYPNIMITTRTDDSIAVKEFESGYQRAFYDERTKSINFVDMTHDECDFFLEENIGMQETFSMLLCDLFELFFYPIG